jgi:ankyrin repeat protein
MWAAAEGQVEVVEELIKAGADFRTSLSTGYTPFLFAVREGRGDVVRALLKAGANVNETIETRQGGGPRPASGAGVPRPGNTALHLAVVNGHFELAAMLLDAGADPNAAGVGYTPLHILTIVRKPGGGDNDPAPRGSGTMTSLELVKEFAKHGANLNARMTRRANLGLTGLNTLGATPFLMAAKSGDAELMRTLASLGADPLLPNADGATPLIVAAGLGTRSPGEDAGTESEVLEAVQVALDLGNDINAVDNNGETAMHGAAYKNLPAVVELLAAKGARIEVWNQKNKHGWTPLTIAEGHRFGNYKPSPVTVAAFHRVMTAAGVPIVAAAKPAGAGRNSDYVKPPSLPK